MSLKKIKYLDYGASYDFAPPVSECVINTAEICRAIPCEVRGARPACRVFFNDGTNIVAVGTPDQFLETE